MQIIKTIAQMCEECARIRAAGKSLGFVPTMGALHDGHLSLIRLARAQCDAVAVSLFVNPKQFGPNEDLAKYPRPFERDREMLEHAQVELLFAPTVEEMYPAGAVTNVYVEGLSERLDGRSRPGHFRGVTTVVAKLFNIVGPERAYFGQKDSAQVAIVRKMVADLSFPVEIVVGPIIRDPDGLAMSSRNVYLSPPERKQATILYRALREAEAAYLSGEREPAKLLESMSKVLGTEPAAEIEYAEIVNPHTLDPIQGPVASGALVAVAAKFGGTRLIDNIVLHDRKVMLGGK